jgi:ATP-dependent Clp protease ATP-binding subunit ClpA
MAEVKFVQSRFTETGWRVFGRAVTDARARAQNCIMPAHLLAALADVERGTFDALLAELHVERAATESVVEARINAGPRYTGPGVRLAPETIEVCKLALKRAESSRRTKIEPVDLLVALTLAGRGHLLAVFNPLGVRPADLLKVVLDIETAVEVARVVAAGGVPLIGRAVRIKSGPFASFTGYVANVNETADKLEIGVAIMGARRFIELGPDDIIFIDFDPPAEH